LIVLLNESVNNSININNMNNYLSPQIIEHTQTTNTIYGSGNLGSSLG